MPNRSPTYPSVSLPVALERVTSLHDAWGPIELCVRDALDCWGYKPIGGAGYRLVAATISFGLLDSSGEGNERRLRISDDALDNFFSSKVSAYEKSEAIKAFAMNPRIYQVLWERWGDNLPEDSELKQFLVDDLGFNPRMVPQFLRGYHETIELAREHGLGKPHDELDEDDTELDFDEDEVKFAFKPQEQDDLYTEDDTDLELKIAAEVQRSLGRYTAFQAGEDDTNAEVTTVDLPLEPITNSTEYYLDDDHIDFKLTGTDDADVNYSGNMDKIGNLFKKRIEKSQASEIKEITRYMVANNCNIYLSADGLVDRQAIEALIAQLKLQLELGEFDSEGD
jgi:hypothetical protein